MASQIDPRSRATDCPNAPSAMAIRTSESICERSIATIDVAELATITPRQMTTFEQMQARYG